MLAAERAPENGFEFKGRRGILINAVKIPIKNTKSQYGKIFAKWHMWPQERTFSGIGKIGLM